MTDALDIGEQLERLLNILQKEVTNLHLESSKGKLSASSARDLVSYVKTLSDIKVRQDKELADLPDDKLEELE
jgi:hypothetical protein